MMLGGVVEGMMVGLDGLGLSILTLGTYNH
jgi:hypothetical protein